MLSSRRAVCSGRELGCGSLGDRFQRLRLTREVQRHPRLIGREHSPEKTEISSRPRGGKSHRLPVEVLLQETVDALFGRWPWMMEEKRT